MRTFRALAARPSASLWLVAVVALASCLLPLPVIGFRPVPNVPDEYANLLAADTFRHGRLTNEPHPLHRHMDAPHVLFEPTYSSKYPAGQGMFMALGWVLTGRPIVGVWLSFVLMAVAVCWMLRAFVPARWAVIGAFIIILRFGFANYWAQGYCGGAVAALGGALVLRALRRLWDRPGVGVSLLFGLGLGLMALGRPLEGAVRSIAPLALLAWRALGWARGKRWSDFARGIVPAAVVGLLFLVFILAHNRAVTGSATTPPYVAHNKAVNTAPPFVFMRPSEESYERYKKGETLAWELYLNARSVPGLIEHFKIKSGITFSGYFGPWLIGLLAFVPFMWRQRWGRLLLAVGAAVVGIDLVTTYYLGPHYVAPAACLLTWIIVSAMRRVAGLRLRSHRLGVYILAVVFAGLTIGVVTAAFDLRKLRDKKLWFGERVRLEQKLESNDTRDLVLVRHVGEVAGNDTIIFNLADLDDADAVWAYEPKTPAEIAELIAAFPARKVWLVKYHSDALVDLELSDYPRR